MGWPKTKIDFDREALSASLGDSLDKAKFAEYKNSTEVVMRGIETLVRLGYIKTSPDKLRFSCVRRATAEKESPLVIVR